MNKDAFLLVTEMGTRKFLLIGRRTLTKNVEEWVEWDIRVRFTAAISDFVHFEF